MAEKLIPADIRYHFSDLPKGERAYEADYQCTAFKVKDEYSKGTFTSPTKRIRVGRGPIFPFFLNADFSSYGGFRLFTELYGLEGLAYLDATDNKYYPLESELKKRVRGESEYLTRSYLKNQVFKRIKDQLIEDQKNMRLFYECFVTGEHPTMNRPDYRQPMPQDTIPNWPFITTREGKTITGSKALFNILRHHLSYVRVVPAWESEPVLGKYGDIWSGVLRKRKTDQLFGQEKRVSMNKIADGVTRISTLCESTDWKKASLKWVGWRLEYTTIPSRCYMEMLDLIQDEKELKRCENCGKIFIPSRRDELNCSRIIQKQRDTIDGRKRTCKDVGPEQKFYKTKSATELEALRKKKQFQNRLLYCKRKGHLTEYQRIEKEFQQWQREKENKKKKG